MRRPVPSPTAAPDIGYGREGSMESVLMRVGLWFTALVLAIIACALSVDWGFGVHMGVCALAAGIGLIVTLRGGDFSAAAAPGATAAVQSRYYDDVIRWAVIATVFWGMAGFLAGLWSALEMAFPVLTL
eukprot:gene36183-46303_t